MRSGLPEGEHRGHALAVDPDGRALAGKGDPDHVFFLRSTAKPFQALVALDHGADLTDIQLAVACSSHSAEPVHVAIVTQMLTEAGVDVAALACPTDRPMHRPADRRLAASGDTAEAALLHNCSGKHAAYLRACAARGWSLDYTDPTHPLQAATLELMRALTGVDPEPVGVDGCGFPTMRTTLTGLARAFAALATDPAMARVRTVMHRYPALTAGSGRPETALGTVLHAAVKGGAMGSLGVAVIGQGAIATKSSSGSITVAASAAAALLEELGWLSHAQRDALRRVAAPSVRGGGRVVGAVEPAR